ncbi:MAG: hypothetical protein ACE5EL_06690 [Anaerolineae bacterium]
MAKRRRSPRRPSVPPPKPRAPKGRRHSRAPEKSRKAPRAAATVAPEDLGVRYAHVKRDLIRIAVLAAIMFGLIYATTLVSIT